MAECMKCSAEYSERRAALGYKTCLPCGEKETKNTKRTVVPMHKSNYVLITNRQELSGVNNKTIR